MIAHLAAFWEALTALLPALLVIAALTLGGLILDARWSPRDKW